MRRCFPILLRTALLGAVLLAVLPAGLEARTRKVPSKLREFTGRVIKESYDLS